MIDVLSGSLVTGSFAALFLGCMIMAATYDLTSYTIPNYLSLILLAGFVSLGIFQELGLSVIGSHFSAGIALLAIGWTLFALGVVGGGDAKFMAASGIWIGWSEMLDYLLVFSVAGGVLALLLLLFRRLPLPEPIREVAWIAQLHGPGHGVPYGVALSIGAVATMPHLTLFASQG